MLTKQKSKVSNIRSFFYFRRAKVLNLKTVSEDKGMEANKRKAENGEFGLKIGIFL